MGPDSSSVQEAQVTEDEDLGDEEQKTGTETVTSIPRILCFTNRADPIIIFDSQSYIPVSKTGNLAAANLCNIHEVAVLGRIRLCL